MRTGVMAALDDDSLALVRLKARSLSSWVVKVSLEAEVCVEGQLDGRYWHTTAIKAALTPDLLLTNTGSHYALDGPIDRCAAAKLGFPSHFAAAFEAGFPPNWRDLVSAFVHNLANSHKRSAFWYEDATAVAAPAASFRRPFLPIQAKPPPPPPPRRRSQQPAKPPSLTPSVNTLMIVEMPPSEGEEDEPEVREEDEEEEEEAKPAEKDVPVEKPTPVTRKSPRHSPHIQPAPKTPQPPPAPPVQSQPSQPPRRLPTPEPTREPTPEPTREPTPEPTREPTPEPTREPTPEPTEVQFKVPVKAPAKAKRDEDEVPAVAVSRWCLFLHSKGTVTIQGHLPGNPKPWGSSRIVRAHAADVVESSSGSRYRLHGPINLERTINRGKVPPSIAELFENGFPRKWRSLLAEAHLNITMAREAENSAYHGAPQSSRFIDASIRPDSSISHSRSREVSVASSRGQESQLPAPRRPPPKKEKKRKAEGGRGRMAAGGSESSDSTGPRRSLSGRILKAPLASWSGERIVYDTQGEPISIALPVTQSIHKAGDSRPLSDLSLTLNLAVAPRLQAERRLSSPRLSKVKKRRIAPTSDSDHSDDEVFKVPRGRSKKVAREEKVSAKKRASSPRTKPASPVKKKKKKKAARWSQADLKRLQVALKAIQPEWEDEEAWGRVGRALAKGGGELGALPVEKIREKASDVFGYELQLSEDAAEEARRAREAAAMAELSGKRRVPGSAAAFAEARRFADSFHRNASGNSSQDVFNQSVLPSLGGPAALSALPLASLAELNESDLSDVLTPPPNAARGHRAERRFFPQPPRLSDTSFSEVDSPVLRRRPAPYRNYSPALPSGPSSSTLAATHASRAQMLANENAVAAQLRSARHIDDQSDSSFEDYE